MISHGMGRLVDALDNVAMMFLRIGEEQYSSARDDTSDFS
jgi:hypothetical protein